MESTNRDEVVRLTLDAVDSENEQDEHTENNKEYVGTKGSENIPSRVFEVHG